ncbi:MAG: hypothetical protein Q9187_003653 [Circinaria calcarea]
MPSSQGILFLTTNRVGTVDQAFKSRIHITLHYPALDKTTTVQIWKNNLSMIKEALKKDGKAFKIEKNDILAFAKSHFEELKRLGMGNWNGRQIRNAVQTAIAIADFEVKNDSTPILNRSQFEKVAQASKEFDEYLLSVYKGRDAYKIAHDDQVRDDRWHQRKIKPEKVEPVTLARASAKAPSSARAGKASKARRPESEKDVDTESESESDDSDDSDDSEDNTEDGSQDDSLAKTGDTRGESDVEEFPEPARLGAKAQVRHRSMVVSKDDKSDNDTDGEVVPVKKGPKNKSEKKASKKSRK